MNKQLFNQLFLFITLTLFISLSAKEIELIKNGYSNYKIIISKNATSTERKAASELQKYFEEISNTKLEIVNDTDIESGSEILIGENNKIRPLIPIATIDSLGEDGFIIKTVGNKLLIVGGKRKGTLYGVYTFLEKYLNCRMYTPDVLEIPKSSVISIPEINITEIPKIKYRELQMPFARTSQKYCDWHKLHHYSFRESTYGSFVHTFHRLVPPEIYFKEHPEYFSEINGERYPDQQLCLSNPNVFEIIVNELKKKMKEKPEATVWDVSQNDNFGYCTCKECSRIDSIYQSPSGSIINFVNKIAREFPKKTISTLAYQYSRKAPVGIKPEPNVMIVLCTIECDRSKPIKENKDDLFNRDIKEWVAICNNIKIWDYVVQFSSLINPFPNFHVLQPNIKLFVNHGVKSLFEQGSGNLISDLHELKTYVLAKLMWEPDINVKTVINDFVDGYYGNASKHIAEYFNLRQKAVETSDEGLIIYGYPYTGIKSYLTPNLLKRYTELFDKAELKAADEEKILERVKYARLPLEYAILEISKLNLTDDLRIFLPQGNNVIVNPQMKERLKNFVSTANQAGISRLNEKRITPDEYNIQMQKYFESGMIIHKAYQKDVEIVSKIDQKYFANGSKTLTDGIIGEANYYFNWLGFEATEFEAIVDLQNETEISLIRTNFLQEVKSWIWLPKKVEYFISNDGIDFRKVGKITKKADEHKKGIFTESFNLQLKNISAKYIKIKTKSLINCPKWHIGYNNGKGKAWLFIDEIIVK